MTYVANIYKYYVAYKLIEEQQLQKDKHRAELQQNAPGPR